MGCGMSRVSPSSEPVSKKSFEIERVIGQGGFGKVNAVVKCRGYDKGTWYAMKTLSKNVILQRNHVSMVMKERNLLARLHCPQLVNMHYAFQDDRHLYIVMDVCLGGDLHYQLTSSPTKSFSEDVARFYAASMVVCLSYMHGVGVIHRDVKPENLLLDSRGQLKVTDLGISQELVDGVCNSTSGTRPYMAPEIFMSGHRHTSVADIYSLGITIFQFLVGKRPYSPTPVNMKAIVRMATFVPPEKYKDLREIRRILIQAQERKAPSTDFSYSRQLTRFSPEAMDFVSCCLICNPKYRLGALGVNELMAHPWFAGIDWEAMRKQEVPAPLLPDVRHANCSISAEDLHAMMLEEAKQDSAPEIPHANQLKFVGYDYRLYARDPHSGRGERQPARADTPSKGDAAEEMSAGVEDEAVVDVVAGGGDAGGGAEGAAAAAEGDKRAKDKEKKRTKKVAQAAGINMAGGTAAGAGVGQGGSGGGGGGGGADAAQQQPQPQQQQQQQQPQLQQGLAGAAAPEAEVDETILERRYRHHNSGGEGAALAAAAAGAGSPPPYERGKREQRANSAQAGASPSFGLAGAQQADGMGSARSPIPSLQLQPQQLQPQQQQQQQRPIVVNNTDILSGFFTMGMAPPLTQASAPPQRPPQGAYSSTPLPGTAGQPQGVMDPLDFGNGNGFMQQQQQQQQQPPSAPGSAVRSLPAQQPRAVTPQMYPQPQLSAAPTPSFPMPQAPQYSTPPGTRSLGIAGAHNVSGSSQRVMGAGMGTPSPSLYPASVPLGVGGGLPPPYPMTNPAFFLPAALPPSGSSARGGGNGGSGSSSSSGGGSSDSSGGSGGAQVLGPMVAALPGTGYPGSAFPQHFMSGGYVPPASFTAAAVTQLAPALMPGYVAQHP